MASRIYMVALFLILSAVSCFADEIQIPFAIYEDDFKQAAISEGIDLSGSRESIGFVQSRGAEFSVFTYKQASPELLEKIKVLAFKHMRD